MYVYFPAARVYDPDRFTHLKPMGWYQNHNFPQNSFESVRETNDEPEPWRYSWIRIPQRGNAQSNQQ